MVKIEFNKEESDKRTNNGWNWFYGTATIKDRDFDFTLCEMNTKVGGQNTTATEITWVNDIPDNNKEIQKEIETVFEEEF